MKDWWIFLRAKGITAPGCVYSVNNIKWWWLIMKIFTCVPCEFLRIFFTILKWNITSVESKFPLDNRQKNARLILNFNFIIKIVFKKKKRKRTKILGMQERKVNNFIQITASSQNFSYQNFISKSLRTFYS